MRKKSSESSDAENLQILVVNYTNEVNPSDEEIGSNSGSIGNQQDESWDYTTRDIVTGLWTINVDVTNDDTVDVTNDVTIAYAEGAEDATNPRQE